MPEFVAGEVVVPVVPDASGVVKSLRRQLVPAAVKVGREMQQSIASQMKAIDVPVSADTSRARAAIQELAREAQRASGQSVRVDATADTGAAQAALAALEALLGRVNGRRADVRADADTAGAQAGLAGVEASTSALNGRTANVRVDADVSGALAGIGAVSAALVALPAVAALGLGAAGLAGAAVAAGVGVGALAAVAVPSLTRIAEATKANEAASKAATQASSGAVAAAQQAQIQALNLAAAEQRVADAKRVALVAEQELTRARIDAKRAAEDLALASRNAALSEEDAVLGVAEARQRLAEVAKEHATGKADDLALQRAELSVRQAEQREKEARLRNKRTQQEQKASEKAGIEGSAQVIAAKDKIAQANKRVEDSERSLKLMQLQAIVAAKQQAAAQRGTVAELVKLSPAAALAAKQISSFKDAYLAWQQRLEPAVLPAVTGGLKVLQALFKPLTPLIKGTAGALVGLEKDAAKALGGKFWSSFFKDLSTAAPTAVTGLGKSLGNVATGVAGMIKAFLPFVPTIVGGIGKATAAFATWGKGLGESQGFQTFIKFAAAQIPKLVQLFKSVGSAIGNIVSALAPFGSAALSGISALVGWIAKLSPSAIQAIALAIGGVVLGVKAWAVAQGILNFVLSKNPIGLIITAIGLLVAGLVYAYQNSETFRTIVDGVFQAIGVAATWLWETILKPAFDGLVALWQNVLGPAATWLWQTILKPAFDGIAAAVTWAWTNVIQPAFTALHGFIVNTLGPKIIWFHETIVKPAFDGIAAAIKFAWTNVIQPALKAIWAFITETLAPKFMWLHTTIVKPAIDKIGEVISFVWEKVIKPAFSALWTFITETIPNGFKKGVELIGKFWDGLKAVASKPVEFVVNTIYNNGIRAVWNAVAKALGLSELPELKFNGMARGGILPGTSSYRQGDDQLVAMRRGEGVYVSEAMRNPYERARLQAVNQAAMRGQSLAPFQGLAGGGIVGDILASGVRIGAEKLLNPMLAKASSLMGDSPFAKMLVGVPQKLVADVIKFLEGKEAAQGGPGAAKALAFARAQIGKDYQWGATGPSTFDCSGLTMRAWQAGGRSDIPRTSQQQMGWVQKVAKPVPGALGFPNPGHVWLHVTPSTIIEAPQTGLKVRQVAARAAQVTGVPPAKYDSGGYLPTGHSLVFNGTGSPEPVLTDQQWKSVQGGTQGGDGPMLNIDQFNATPEQSPQAIARELYWLSKGRPR